MTKPNDTNQTKDRANFWWNPSNGESFWWPFIWVIAISTFCAIIFN